MRVRAGFWDLDERYERLSAVGKPWKRSTAFPRAGSHDTGSVSLSLTTQPRQNVGIDPHRG